MRSRSIFGWLHSWFLKSSCYDSKFLKSLLASAPSLGSKFIINLKNLIKSTFKVKIRRVGSGLPCPPHLMSMSPSPHVHVLSPSPHVLSPHLMSMSLTPHVLSPSPHVRVPLTSCPWPCPWSSLRGPWPSLELRPHPQSSPSQSQPDRIQINCGWKIIIQLIKYISSTVWDIFVINK